MARSFVLKDKMSAATGYLMQGAGMIRCRIAGAKEGMKAIMLDESGGFCKREIMPGGGEQTWEDDGKEIIGAAIVLENEIFAQSSREAGMRARTISAREKKNAIEIQNKPEPQQEQEHNEQRQMKEQNEGVFALPQRRWPPPPCMQQAVYRNGVWIQER